MNSLLSERWRDLVAVTLLLAGLVGCSGGGGDGGAPPETPTTSTSAPTVADEVDDLLDGPGFVSHADCVVSRGDVGLDTAICDTLFPDG